MTSTELLKQGAHILAALSTTIFVFAWLNPWPAQKWRTRLYYATAVVFSAANSSFIIYGASFIAQLLFTCVFSLIAAFIEFGLIFIFASIVQDLTERDKSGNW